jgi:hypothetical protein
MLPLSLKLKKFDTHTQSCQQIVNFVTNSNTSNEEWLVEFWGLINYIGNLEKIKKIAENLGLSIKIIQHTFRHIFLYSLFKPTTAQWSLHVHNSIISAICPEYVLKAVPVKEPSFLSLNCTKILASIMNNESVCRNVGYLFSSPNLTRLNYLKIMGFVLLKKVLLVWYV